MSLVTQLGVSLKNNAGTITQTYSEDLFATNTLASYSQMTESGAGTWSISGGQLIATNVASGLLVRNGYTASDTKVECIVTTPFNAGLVLRVQDVNNFYLLQIDGETGSVAPNKLTFYRKFGGSFAILGTLMTVDLRPGTPHTITFQCIGQHFSAYFDGVLVGTVTDSAIMLPGTVGLRVGSNTTTTNFSGLRWNYSNLPKFDPYIQNVICAMRFQPQPTGNPVFKDDKGHSFTGGTGMSLTTTNAKFGSTCLLADGTTNAQLYAPADIDWIIGPADFCVEGWALTTNPTPSQILVIGQATDGTERGITVTVGSNQLQAYCRDDAATGFAASSGGTVTANTWFHWAYTRNGTIFRLFLNGNVVSQVTASGVAGTPGRWNVYSSGTGGNALNGKAQEFRLTVGRPRYTNFFVPSTLPMPDVGPPANIPVPKIVALMNFGLLDSGIRDRTGRAWTSSNMTVTDNYQITNSGNRYVVTPGAGNAMIVQPNASGYMDTVSSSDFNFGSGPWTIEFSISAESTGGTPFTIMDTRDAGNPTRWFIAADANGRLTFYYNSATYGALGAAITAAVAGVPGASNWRRCAITYDGRSLCGFVEGVLQWSVTGSIYIPTSALRIGNSYPGTAGFRGALDEIRITSGLCRYRTDYTPSTVPLTKNVDVVDEYLNNTVLLVRGTDGTFSDTKGHVMTPLSGVSSSPVAPKFGTTAMKFTGPGSLISTPATLTNDFYFTTNNFTIEFWMRTNLVRTHVFVDLYNYRQLTWQMATNPTGQMALYSSDNSSEGASCSGNTMVCDGQWHYICLVRSAGSFTMYVDGWQDGFGTASLNYNYLPTSLALGGQINNRSPAADLYGYMCEVRLTNGVARQQRDFIPPALPHSQILSDVDPLASSTVMLLRGGGINAGAAGSYIDETGRFFGPIGTAPTMSATSGVVPTGTMLTFAPSGGLETYGDLQEFWFNTWTFEGKIKLNALVANAVLAQKRLTAGATTYAFALYFDSVGSSLICALTDPITSTLYTFTCTTPLVVNTWTEFSVQNTGLSIEFRINGQAAGATPYFKTLRTNQAPIRIGRDVDVANGFNGNLSEFRVTSAPRYKGASLNPINRPWPKVIGDTGVDPYANFLVYSMRSDNTSKVYTGTNSSGVWDGAAGSGNVTTNSGNAVLTNVTSRFRNGSLQKTTGAGGMKVTPSGSTLDFGTNDFTIEFYAWSSRATGTIFTLLDMRTSASVGTNAAILYATATAGFVYYAGGAVLFTSPDNQVTPNAWIHWAISRTAGTTYILRNGLLMGSVADTSSQLAATLMVGNDYTLTEAGGLIGYIYGLRLSKGKGRYTAAFTPPIKPSWSPERNADPYRAYKVISLHGDDMIDYNGHQTNSAGGAVTLDTTNKVLGTASYGMSGANTLSIPSTNNLAAVATEFSNGAADFTARFWMRLTNLTTGGMIFSKGTVGSGKYTYALTLDGTNRLVLNVWDSSGNHLFFLQSVTTVAALTWYFVHIVRAGDTFYLFINGNATTLGNSFTLPASMARRALWDAPATDCFSWGGTTAYASGSAGAVSNPIACNIDEFQLYNGVAINTEDFATYVVGVPDW